MDNAIILDFGGARYTFFLPMPRIIECERECGGKSIVTMYEEFSAGIGVDPEADAAHFLGFGGVRIKDVSEVIRCAAIGGGLREKDGQEQKVSPIDASRLVAEYVDGRPYTETVPVAWAILHRTIMGVSLKKKAVSAADEASLSEKAT